MLKLQNNLTSTFSNFVISKPFTFTVDTTQAGSANTTFVLPLQPATYNFTVDWGDGNTDTITTYNQAEKTHVYAVSGTYEIKICGVMEGFAFQNGGDRRKIQNISQWGCFQFSSVLGAFYGCAQMTITATDMPRFKRASTLFNAFNTCNALTDIPGLRNWKTQNVLSHQGVFFSSPSYNGNADNIVTKSSFSMQGMFNGASSFSSTPRGYDTTWVLSMRRLFYNISGYDADISYFNVENCTDMTEMFAGTALSTTNYDKILIAWSQQNVKSNVPAHFGTAKYTAGGEAEAGRNYLLSKGWIITDGGAVP